MLAGRGEGGHKGWIGRCRALILRDPELLSRPADVKGPHRGERARRVPDDGVVLVRGNDPVDVPVVQELAECEVTRA